MIWKRLTQNRETIDNSLLGMVDSGGIIGACDALIMDFSEGLESRPKLGIECMTARHFRAATYTSLSLLFDATIAAGRDNMTFK